LEQQLDRADRYVSPLFVSHLALLDLTRRSDTRPIARFSYDSQVRSYWDRRRSATGR
jgi:hypothetical protein